MDGASAPSIRATTISKRWSSARASTASINRAQARAACCFVRKVEPLNRALDGAQAWIAGLRAEQSAHRHDMALVTAEPERGLIKLNPLFDWSARAASRPSSPPMPSRSTRCTRRASPRSAARPARARSPPASRNAPAAGGGRRKSKKECGLHAAAAVARMERSRSSARRSRNRCSSCLRRYSCKNSTTNRVPPSNSKIPDDDRPQSMTPP